MYVKGDLTIRGSAALCSEENVVGIMHDGNSTQLTIEGDITVGSGYDSLLNTAAFTDVCVTGSLSAECKNGYAIRCESMTVKDGGQVYATGEKSGFTPIDCSGNLTLNGGEIEAVSAAYDTDAIWASNSILVYDGTLMAKVSNGAGTAINTDKMYVYGGQVQAEATVTYSSALGASLFLYDGEVDLASADAGVFLGKDAGLQINGGTLFIESRKEGAETDFAVSSLQNIIMKGGELCVKSPGSGIKASSLQMNGGNLMVDADGTYGLSLGQSGQLNAGQLLINAGQYGLYGEEGSNIQFAGTDITAIGETAAIYSLDENGITSDGSSLIAMPDNGIITSSSSPAYCAVTQEDGISLAKEVVIDGVGKYPLWIGSTQVTEQNKNEIDGITGGGSASFDPQTNTLLFSGTVTGVTGSHENALIWSDMDLKIEGDASLTAGSGENCILTSKDAPLDIIGNLNLSSEDKNALQAQLDLAVEGSLTAESASAAAIYVMDKMNVSGEVEASSQTGRFAIDVQNELNNEGSIHASNQGDRNALNVENGFISTGFLSAEAPKGYALLSDATICILSGETELTGCDPLDVTSASSKLYLSGKIGIHGTSNSWLDGAIDCNGQIFIDNADLTVRSENNMGIHAEKELRIISGQIDVQSAAEAVYGNPLTISDDCVILFPDEVHLDDNNRYLNDADNKNVTSLHIESSPKATVTFDCAGYGTAPEPQPLRPGRRAACPRIDPTDPCAEFDGWFADPDHTVPFDFLTIITDDVTIYGKWKTHHNITFVPRDDALCETDGCEKHYKCTTCQRLFEDKDGTKLISDPASLRIEATGHNFGAWQVSRPATTDADGEEIRICSNNTSHVEKRVLSKLQPSGNDGNQSVSGNSTDQTDSGNEQGKDSGSDGKTENPSAGGEAKKGDKIEDQKSKGVYKVTGLGKDAAVTYLAPSAKNLSAAEIPDTIKIGGKNYKVTAIAAGAFKNQKKLTRITIGKNIRTIGAKAFFGCSKLKKITIKTSALTAKRVGKKAFAKIHSKATCKVPKKKRSLYRKVLKKRGLNGKKQKVK